MPSDMTIWAVIMAGFMRWTARIGGGSRRASGAAVAAGQGTIIEHVAVLPGIGLPARHQKIISGGTLGGRMQRIGASQGQRPPA
jgi:hypothetical protein